MPRWAIRDRSAAGRGLEVELLQGLVPGEFRGLDPQRGAGSFALGDLAGEDSSKVFLMRPPGGAGGVGQVPVAVPDPWSPQRPCIVLNVLVSVGRHRGHSDAPINSGAPPVVMPKAWS